MAPLAELAHEDAGAAPADHDLAAAARLDIAPGPLTYAGNRVQIATRVRPAGTLRIAVVGDSMGYGAGVPYRKSFGARLAAHLNGVAPELWVECVSFGISGACLHHAVGRVETHALPADPEVIIVAVCCNDAIVLGPQPPDLAVLGQQWLTYRPLVEGSLRRFRDTLQRERRRALVVYLDRLVRAGAVDIPAVLGDVCTGLDLPFVNGSAAVATYDPKELIVSEADHHLNGLGHDAIARLVAQSIVTRGWLPASPGFADGGWLEGIEQGARARVAHGLPAPLAYGEALSVLDTKWLHRRNVKRRQFEPAYQRLRDRLVDEQRVALARLACESMQPWLRATHPPASLWQVETWANELMAAAALEPALTPGVLDDPASSLAHLDEHPIVAPSPSTARWELLGERARIAQQVLRQVSSACDGGSGPDGRLEYLTLWTSRVSQWLHVAGRCADRYVDLLSTISPPLEEAAARLVGFAERRLPALEAKTAELGAAIADLASRCLDASRAAGTSHVTLELTASASAGPEPWTMAAGLDSVCPAFSERQVGMSYFVRDGRPHVYEFELPVTLAGEIHLYVNGSGLGRSLTGWRLHRAQLRWPQQESDCLTLPAPAITLAPEDSASFVFVLERTLPISSEPRGL